MHPACFQVDFQPRSPPVSSPHAVGQDRLPGFGMLGRDNFDLGGIRDFAEVIRPGSGGRRDGSLDDGPVLFEDCPGLKLFGQATRRPHVASQHHDARHRPVQAVRDAQIHSSRLAVARPQKFLDPDFQTVDAWRPLRRQASRFGHDQAGALFVEQVEAWRLDTAWIAGQVGHFRHILQVFRTKVPGARH